MSDLDILRVVFILGGPPGFIVWTIQVCACFIPGCVKWRIVVFCIRINMTGYICDKDLKLALRYGGYLLMYFKHLQVSLIGMVNMKERLDLFVGASQTA